MESNVAEERCGVVGRGISRPFLRFSTAVDGWTRSITPDEVVRLDMPDGNPEISGPVRYVFRIRCVGSRCVDVNRWLKFAPPAEGADMPVDMKNDMRLWPGDVGRIVIEDRCPDAGLVDIDSSVAARAVADRFAVIAADAALDDTDDTGD